MMKSLLLLAALGVLSVHTSALAQSAQPAPTDPAAAPAGQPAPADAASAPVAQPAPDAAPATPAAPDVAPAAAASAADVNTVLVAYVRHTKPPVLIDSTPAKASFALVGAAAMIAVGHQIVVDNDIKDPSGDMALEIAKAYAAAHGGKVVEDPILDEHLWTRAKSDKLSGQANGAHYVVDVDPPGMNLIYFSLDWTHFDLMFNSYVRIIDTSNNQVVSKARCFIRTKKTPETLGHEQLLADKAAGLKKLIVAKSEECVAKLEADLKLDAPAPAPVDAKTST